MKKSLALVLGLLGLAGGAAACSSTSDPGESGDTPTPGSEAGPVDDSGGGPVENPDSGGPGPVDSGGDTSAPVDAGTDARPDPSCTGMLYCDSFESYAITGAIKDKTPVGPWTTSVSGAAVMTIDGVKPYGGAQALHIKVPNNDTGASALLDLTKATGIVTGNKLFGRAMVYYGKTAADGDDVPNGVHSWIFQGIGPSTASGKNMSLNLANHGDTYFLNYHGDITAKPEASKNGGKPVAAKWVCMQWEYDSSGTPATDEAKVWADGALIIDATKTNEKWDLATPFSTIQFGFTHYQVLQNAIDVYLDDYAINTAMIACP